MPRRKTRGKGKVSGKKTTAVAGNSSDEGNSEETPSKIRKVSQSSDSTGESRKRTKNVDNKDREPPLKRVMTENVDESSTRPSSPDTDLNEEPDSPPAAPAVKRNRRLLKKFSFSDFKQEARKKTPKKGPKLPKIDEKELLFERGDFLAVRAEDEPFYLCQSLQHVYSSSAKFRVLWYEVGKTNKNEYNEAKTEDGSDVYINEIEVHLIKMKKKLYRLPDVEINRVNRLVAIAEKGDELDNAEDLLPIIESGGEGSNDDDTSDVDSDDDDSPADDGELEDSSDADYYTEDEIPTAKGKTVKQKIKKIIPKNKAKTAKIKPVKEKKEKKLKAPRIKKPRIVKTLSQKERDKIERKEKAAILRQNPNRKLKPNENVTLWDKEPLTEDDVEVPFISTKMHSLLVTRAVKLEDVAMLNSLIQNHKEVHSLTQATSMQVTLTPLHYAVEKESEDLIKILAGQLHQTYAHRLPRAPGPSVLMRVEGTGTYNPMSLGIQHVRKIQMSRGGKEGNNALSKDLYTRDSVSILKHALMLNVSWKTLQLLELAKVITYYDLYSHIHVAIRYGHRKLAAKLMDESKSNGDFGFNFIHRDVLAFDDEDWQDPLKEVSVRKKPTENKTILPLHCACINPNTKYMSKLFSIVPDYNILDNEQRRPIHYAAVCDGVEPLKFLLNKGVSVDEPDQEGMTPVLYACEIGRSDNVRVIIEHTIKQQDEMGVDAVVLKKYGKGNVDKPMANRPVQQSSGRKRGRSNKSSATRLTKAGWSPLHFAVAARHMDVVKTLLDLGADKERCLPANYNKLTPLMMASSNGDLEMVKLLVESNAKIEKPDKLKRTPLIHAVKNGAAHVVSYFLRKGANPNQADSSGNSALHYAAAYGWYFCLKALLEAGAQPDEPNHWKLTPLGASFLKGNTGITAILADTPGVNIDFQDDQGRTLLMNAVTTSPLSHAVLEQVRHLVEKKNASVVICDKEGSNVIHLLIKNSLPTTTQAWGYVSDEAKEENRRKREEAKEVAMALAKLFVDHGVDTVAVDNRDNDIVDLFMSDRSSCPDVFKYLVAVKGRIREKLDSNGCTLLHKLVALKKPGAEEEAWLDFFCNLKSDEGECGLEVLRKMARVRNCSGNTPLMDACALLKNTLSPSALLYVEEMKNMHDFVCRIYSEFKSEVQYVWKTTENTSTENPVTKKSQRTVLTSLIQARETDNNVGSYFTLKKFVKNFGANPNVYLDNGQTLLMQYANKDEGQIKALLSVGADPNLKSKPPRNTSPFNRKEKDEQMTAILFLMRHASTSVSSAFEVQHVAVKLKLFLDNGAELNVANAVNGNTCLHYAVNIKGGKGLELVKCLLDMGIRIDAQDAQKRTPLHLAANLSSDNADESKEVEQLLMKKGADLFIRDTRGRLPLHYLFVKIDGHNNTSAIDPVESFTLFGSAMKYKDIDVKDTFGQTALHRAAYRGATVCCMMLVGKGADINAEDNDGNTALALAVWKGHNSCALTLMQKGADINRDIINQPDADKPPVETKDELKEKMAPSSDSNESDSCSHSSDSESGYTFGNRRAAKFHRPPLKKKRTSVRKREMIRSAQQKLGHKTKEPIKFLSRHYPAPWMPGKRGYPIFQGLVKKGWQGLTYIAIDLLEPFGMKYAKAVEIAIKINKFRFALTLMSKQMDDSKLLEVNDQKQTLLHVLAECASSSGDAELQEKIFVELLDDRHLDVNAVDDRKMTALHYACLKRNYRMIEWLCAREEVKGNEYDEYDRTALGALLWEASHMSQHSIVSLINGGAVVDVLVDYPPLDTFRGGYQPNFGRQDYSKRHDHRYSPLIRSICWSDYNMMMHLLRKGSASLSYADENGWTPLMYAARMNDSYTMRILLTDTSTDIFNVLQHRDDQNRHDKMIREYFVVTGGTEKELGVFGRFMPLKKPVKGVNLNEKDKDGRTAVHHCICNLPQGVYQNVEILKMLHDCGADLNVGDNWGKTPLDYCKERGAHLAAVAIKALLKDETEWAHEGRFAPVNDGIDWPNGRPDFEADAKSLSLELEKKEAEEVDENWLKTDSRAACSSNSELVVDEEQSIPYEVLMTKVDVRIGEFGLYNFYKMQVIHDKEKDMYVLFTCWGRIGDDGMYQRTPYGNVEEAINEFSRIFKAKSGNDWSNVKSFENQPKKYRLVEADYRKRNKPPDVAFDLEGGDLPSRLPPLLQDLMMDVTCVSMLKNSTHDTQINVPFGRLKIENIQKGRQIIRDLRPLVERKAALEQAMKIEVLEEYRDLCQQICRLSSEYYYLVPQKGYEYERLVPLDSVSALDKQGTRLASLLELEYAGRVLLAAQYRVKEENPLDYVYRAMNIEIKQMDSDCDMAEMILKYISASNERVDVEAIYYVARSGESDRLETTKLANHRLLWHGSRTSNLISILSRGLLIAPPEAPATGYAFGKGIYTADTFQKSMGYCHNDSGGRSKYMLLCEVALGEVQRHDTATFHDVNTAVDSVRGVGNMIPDPNYDVALPNGTVISTGKSVQNNESYTTNRCYRSLAHNEYIVYNEDQVAIRYIVQFR